MQAATKPTNTTICRGREGADFLVERDKVVGKKDDGGDSGGLQSSTDDDWSPPGAGDDGGMDLIKVATDGAVVLGLHLLQVATGQRLARDPVTALGLSGGMDIAVPGETAGKEVRLHQPQQTLHITREKRWGR